MRILLVSRDRDCPRAQSGRPMLSLRPPWPRSCSCYLSYLGARARLSRKSYYQAYCGRASRAASKKRRSTPCACGRASEGRSRRIVSRPPSNNSNSDPLGAPASSVRSRSIDQSLPGCRGRSNMFGTSTVRSEQSSKALGCFIPTLASAVAASPKCRSNPGGKRGKYAVIAAPGLASSVVWHCCRVPCRLQYVPAPGCASARYGRCVLRSDPERPVRR